MSMSKQPSMNEVRCFLNMNRLAQLACQAKNHAVLESCFSDSSLIHKWVGESAFDSTKEDYFSKCAEAWQKEADMLQQTLTFDKALATMDWLSYTSLSSFLLQDDT